MKDRLERIADKRLLRSAIRLIKCIKSNAPVFVKCSEVALMSKFLPLYGEAFSRYRRHVDECDIAGAKNDIGVCSEDGCQRPIEDDQSSSRGSMTCKRCRLRAERQARILDESADELFGSHEPVED